MLVCGDDLEAKREVITLIEQLPGARGVDAGPLGSAYYLEAFTAVLLRINRGYRAHTSLQITHLPEPPHVILSEAKDPSSRGTDSSPAGSE